MSRKRRNHSPDFKAKVALAAIKGDETLIELAKRYQINANLIVKWKKLLLENSAEVFASGKGLAPDRESEIKSLHIQISMDGRGAWRDNVFVERVWRSVKYEEVYLNAYVSMAEAKSGIGNWIEYYNHARKYQTLGTNPELMYAGSTGLRKAA